MKIISRYSISTINVTQFGFLIFYLLFFNTVLDLQLAAYILIMEKNEYDIKLIENYRFIN